MAIFRLILANLKKRRTYTAAIFSLIFLAGFLMTTSIATVQKSTAIYDETIESVKSPHLIYYFSDEKYKTDYEQWLKDNKNVSDTQVNTIYHIDEPVFKVGSKEFGQINAITLEAYDKNNRLDNSFPIGKNQFTGLKKGEALVPAAFKQQLGLAEGDSFILHAGGKLIELKVAGFFKDPLWGTPTISLKRIKISNDDFENIIKPLASDKNKYISKQTALSVRFADKTTLKSIKKDFTEKFIQPDNSINYDSSREMSILSQQLTLTVLIVFSILLCVLSLLVIRYSILSAIEADYTTLGILKGLGFTPGNINSMISGQYAFISVIAIIGSFIAGIFSTPLLGRSIMESTGLPWEGNAPFGTAAIGICTLTLVVISFTLITVRRTRKISPVTAIRHGMADVQFSPFFSIKLSRINRFSVNTMMILKQITSRIKNYILLFIVSILLALSLVSVTLISNTLSGERIFNMFGLLSADIWVLGDSSKVAPDTLVSELKSRYDVQYAANLTGFDLIVGDISVYTTVSKDFDETGELPCYKGRNPMLYNEVAITPVLSKQLNKGIGSYIKFKNTKGEEYNLLVTGLYQSTNDLGNTARINKSAADKMNPATDLNDIYIKLKNDSNIDKIIEDIRTNFNSKIIKATDYSKLIKDGLGTLQSSIATVALILLAASIVIVAIVTLLLSKVAAFKEKKEMGIFKSMGFTSGQIRMQFAVRFLLVTTFGVIIGSLIAILFTGSAFSAILSSIGIASFKVDSGYPQVLAEMVCILLFAFLAAYQSSGIAKKVTAYNLINE